MSVGTTDIMLERIVLKMLTKEELEQALLNLHCYAIYDAYEHERKELDADMCKLKQLINEHFDNPPLTFKEFKSNVWVWDNEHKNMYFVDFVDEDKTIGISNNYGHICMIFKENRFYRKQVEEQSNE